MAKIDDGELYLEIAGATDEQVSAGLIAARRTLVGVNIADALAAQARVDECGQTELAWEQGLVSEPDEPSEGDVELADRIDEAWWNAVLAAGFDPKAQMVVGRFCLLGQEQEGELPVLRDLFEAVH